MDLYTMWLKHQEKQIKCKIESFYPDLPVVQFVV